MGFSMNGKEYMSEVINKDTTTKKEVLQDCVWDN